MKAAILVVLLTTVRALSQTGQPPASPVPTFEVASVKVAADPKGLTLSKGGAGYPSPTLWTATNWSLSFLITRAWHLSQPQISGPASMEDARYDITAKVPPNASPDDFNRMLQTLLTERIGLVTHHELREQPVYEMSIVKGGPKMKESEPLHDGEKAQAYSTYTKDGDYRLVARMTRFFDIVKWWERFVQRPIVDHTGLSGNFDFVLEFPPPEPLGQSSAAMSAVAVSTGEAMGGAYLPRLTFPEAVEKQLGLRLEAKKGKADVLVNSSGAAAKATAEPRTSASKKRFIRRLYRVATA
ncbi:MAG: TIGR03435 family protein [Ignavibacteriota bacterium]